MSMSKRAGIGDTISFKKKDHTTIGVVYLTQDNSVLVEISQEDTAILNLENNKTVVAHKNYTLLSKKNKKIV
ncbi:DUF2187 domain-containing protein [Cytobacillus praedii]|uniref:DUF2187 domain-containing protein n=2 Tax=Cytobacillus praedii TaxID=1742358 RepID=A0A4V2NTS0_9BACI|nr:DUF2187 domain-containing protein [Cytobacillus praedii]